MKIMPTPTPQPHVTRMKCQQSAPRVSASKRKILMDDAMILHGEYVPFLLLSICLNICYSKCSSVLWLLIMEIVVSNSVQSSPEYELVFILLPLLIFCLEWSHLHFACFWLNNTLRI